MTDKFKTADNAPDLVGALLEEVTLDANGEFFDGNDPDSWEAADQAPIEVVSHGAVRFKIVDADATDLALATGFIDPDGPLALSLRVAFEEAEGAPQPVTGQYIVLPTSAGVNITFMVVITRSDLDDPAAPDLGPGAVHNEAFDALEAGQGLLVQVLNDEVNADEMEAA
jgi:hypothetical protein